MIRKFQSLSVAIFVISFEAHMNISFNVKVKISIFLLVKWSFKIPSSMLIDELRMVNKVWAHVYLVSILRSHQTIHHSNKGVCSRWVTELGFLIVLIRSGFTNKRQTDPKLTCIQKWLDCVFIIPKLLYVDSQGSLILQHNGRFVIFFNCTRHVSHVRLYYLAQGKNGNLLKLGRHIYREAKIFKFAAE